MDTKEIEEAVSNVRRYFDHDSAKQILKEKYEAKLLFAAFDGMWKAGPELISITKVLQDLQESVLKDEYGNPCSVSPVTLCQMAGERWQEQMNAWHQEFTELQKQR